MLCDAWWKPGITGDCGDTDYGDTTAFTYIAPNVDCKLIDRPLGAGQARPQARKPGRRRG
jgi:hypothetical protein